MTIVLRILDKYNARDPEGRQKNFCPQKVKKIGIAQTSVSASISIVRKLFQNKKKFEKVNSFK